MGPDDPLPTNPPDDPPPAATDFDRAAPLESDAQLGAEIEALCAEVEQNFESTHFPWLERLVNTPSHTYAKEDVEAAGVILDEMAQELGLRCEKVPDDSGRFADHRIYHTPVTESTTSAVALVGHFDTVFPRSMGFLTLRREADGGDKIFGPGVLDMKSGLSTIFFALRAIHRLYPEVLAKTPLRIVCNSEEEIGSPTSAALFDRLAPHTTAALVFEGGRSEDKVITQRKGGGSFTLTAHGKAAHAGNNHALGRNAIVALAHVLPRIEAITDYDRGVTLNVGMIEGGTAKNTVPDRASAVIDTRFETKDDADAVVEALQALAKDPFAGLSDVPDKLREVRFELSGSVTRYPMQATEPSQALRRGYERWAAHAGLQIGEAPRQGGGSDANLLSALGVPSIDGLGPYGQYFHQPTEWSSLSSLKRRTQALACFLWAQPPTAMSSR